jgi:hypothetical protein
MTEPGNMSKATYALPRHVYKSVMIREMYCYTFPGNYRLQPPTHVSWVTGTSTENMDKRKRSELEDESLVSLRM